MSLTQTGLGVLVALSVGVAGCMGQPQEEAGTSADEVNTGEEATSVLFSLDSVKDIQLDLDPASVAAMSAQADAAYGNLDLMFEKRLTAKGTFRVNLAQPRTDPKCDTTKAYEVKVKIKGMASVQGFDRKPSLKIDFDKPFCGLKNLALNNMVQDTTFVNEALAYKTYEAMGVPAPRLGYSFVVVNGAPLGLYLSLEAIDKRFLARHFSDATGPIYEGTYGGDLRHGDVGTRLFEFTGEDDDPEAAGNPQMHELISAIDAPDDHVFYGPGQLIDTAEFTSMLATAYVIGDWDNYPTANNYRVYRNPQTGLWSFIPTGTDQTFGAQMHPYENVRGAAGIPVLVQKCFASARCSAEYGQRVMEAANQLVAPEGTLAGTALRRAAVIADAVSRDGRRPQTDEQIAATRASLAAFIAMRPAQIQQMMALPGRPSQCGIMHPGEGLIPGRSVGSCDGRFVLTLQATDGNVVLYRNDGVALWSTATTNAMALFVQGDGNMVAYDRGHAPLWDSQTNGHDGAFFAVQDDGNLVAYQNGQPVWASNTAQ